MENEKNVVIVNRNRKGEVFDPAEYLVRREALPEIYKILERKRGTQK